MNNIWLSFLYFSLLGNDLEDIEFVPFDDDVVEYRDDTLPEEYYGRNCHLIIINITVINPESNHRSYRTN
jgi:hypothetical protein